MKINIKLAAITIMLSLLSAFSKPQIHNTATVNQVQGLYIFIECQPTAQYEALGTVKKTGLVWSGKAKEMRDILIKKAKDDYPAADGLIFDDIALDHATAVKFK